jgi:hypothetical protein
VSRGRAALLAWTLAVAALVAAPAPAGAQGGGLAAARAACDAAVAKRVASLGEVKGKVDAAAHLTAPDKSTLDSQIDAASTGLTQLRATIDADTTLAKLRTDCRVVVTGFRVYLVLIPKAYLVVAADRAEAAGDALNRLAGLLQARVAAAQARGRNVTSAGGYVSDIGIKVQAAQSAAAAVPASVLALQATGYPANRQTLVTARTSLATARGALRGALDAAQLAINALK